eukprot:1661636-Prymnesium_polylepis.1
MHPSTDSAVYKSRLGSQCRPREGFLEARFAPSCSAEYDSGGRWQAIELTSGIQVTTDRGWARRAPFGA